MKKPVIVFLFLCLSVASRAQMRMAIIGGPVSAHVRETNSLPGWETTIKPGYSSRSGLHLGILIDVPVKSRLSFEPGLMFMGKGRKYYMNNDTLNSIITDTISSASNLSVNYIEAPLNIAYRLPLGKRANFLISAGPYVGFFYSGKNETQTRIYSSNTFKTDDEPIGAGTDPGKVKTLDFGWNARAGFEIGNILVTGFVSNGLSNFYHAEYAGTFRHQVAGASLAIWLNKLVKTTGTHPVHIPAKLPDPSPKPAFKDSDGDGISDAADQCPNQAGPPEFNGCPIPDTDGDGLIDTEDGCPTEAGPQSNHGCPVQKPDTAIREVEKKINFAAKNIFFNAYSDQLTIESQKPLDEIAEMLTLHPDAHIIIEGHTDATGKAAANKLLSQKRAETVKNYLVSNGVDELRVRAIGYGSEKPVDTNKTAEGRARNRRVELKLIQ